MSRKDPRVTFLLILSLPPPLLSLPGIFLRLLTSLRDLRAPRNARDGGGENSVNAGIDLGDPDSFDPLELTSPLQFAAEVDILRAMMATGSLTVDIGTSDYARYYRD